MAVPQPDTARGGIRLGLRLPARFGIPDPLPCFGATVVKKMDTRNEVQAVLDAVLPEFLRPREAAAILHVSTRSLDRYRTRGGGPAYYMFGNSVVYALADLADWVAARRYRNTSQLDSL